MKNARIRFALCHDGRLHDYAAGRVIEATGNLETDDGVWDLEKVRLAIEDDKFIDAAFTPGGALEAQAQLHQTKKKLKWAMNELAKRPAPVVDPNVDKVEQAKTDFTNTIDQSGGSPTGSGQSGS